MDNNDKEDTTTVADDVVVKGDCIWNIVNKQLGDWARYREIYNLNKDIIKDPSMSKIGQKLILPYK